MPVRACSGLADAYANAGPSADPSPPPEGVAVDDVLTSLAAAGHAPILLSLRPRVAAIAATFGEGGSSPPSSTVIPTGG